MDGDLIDRVTKALVPLYPVKNSIDARLTGGITIRRWDKEARVDVHPGLHQVWGANIIEVTGQVATTLRALGYLIHVTEMDEYHGAMRTYTPPPTAWSPQ